MIDPQKWETLLDGCWTDESGEDVAQITGGMLVLDAEGLESRLQVEGRPWPVTCTVAGEFWEGAIVDKAKRIVWKTGNLGSL